jgi:hypothetical protein
MGRVAEAFIEIPKQDCVILGTANPADAVH